MSTALLETQGTVTPSGWHGALSLRFGLSNGKTDLTGRAHRGPLRVQKPLYPEGHDLCHVVILHPPGGIAAGDTLEMDIKAEAGTRALITTPGAGKWYRSGGRPAKQKMRIAAEADAGVEWLPQEAIFYNGVQASLATEVILDSKATFLGLETFCLGRIAAGETFRQGSISLSTRIERNGILLWCEQGRLTGGSPWLQAAPGLAGYPFNSTLLATGPAMERSTLKTVDPSGTCNSHETHRALLAGFETESRSSRDIEPEPFDGRPIEGKSVIDLEKVIVGTNLDRPISGIGHLDVQGGSTDVQFDITWFDEHFSWNHAFSSRVRWQCCLTRKPGHV